MKKTLGFAAAFFSIFALAACGQTKNTTTTTEIEEPSTTTEAPTTTTTTIVPTTTEATIPTKEFKAAYVKGTTSGEYNLTDSVQDGAILHAWNWSYNTIKDQMKYIAQSGYTAVQTSPVQQCKSSAKTGSWSSEWSKLYQPVAFSVAADSYLGTKEELGAMCQEASKYGVKVIVDIVSNHLANDNTGNAGTYSERIGEFEEEIYNNTSTYFHQYLQNVADTSALTVTQYELSCLPDLNTGNEYIQSKVTGLLKECIDLGVSGFRFDAAKHIETPDDGEYASNFWPTILDASTEYAKTTYNREMYYYGEILNTCGGGRRYDSYTKYMSVTDSRYSSTIVGATAKSLLSALSSYNVNSDGTKAVAWAESHDTYADGTSANRLQSTLNRIYAIEASHGGAANLYFARPAKSTAMGEMGTKAWKSAEISAINHFHSSHLNDDEYATIQDSMYMNERGNESAAIISVLLMSSSKNITLKATKLKDGTYYDQVTGNEFKITDGVITGTMGASGIVVLESNKPTISPSITVNNETGYFYDSIEISVTVKNATSASYTVNGVEAPLESLTASNKIQVSSDTDTAVVTIKANNGLTTEETFTYYKVEKKEGYVACAGLKAVDSVSYFAWVWPKGGNGKWAEVTIEGNIAYLAMSDEYSNYLLVSFDKDMTLEKLNASSSPWDLKQGQTQDFEIKEDVIHLSTI